MSDKEQAAPLEKNSEPQNGKNMALDPKLLQQLICPKSRGPLTYDKETGELISRKAKLAYPIRGGVPIMLIDEARTLET